MLAELCAELKNYFLRDKNSDIHCGEYTISDGSIDLAFLLDGQYFRIVGSVLNDGVYRYPACGLTDEEFSGAVWAMAVPPAVIALSEEIEAWNTQYINALNSPYQSEGFEVYNRSLKSGVNGRSYTWRDHFASRLIPYRRLSVL